MRRIRLLIAVAALGLAGSALGLPAAAPATAAATAPARVSASGNTAGAQAVEYTQFSNVYTGQCLTDDGFGHIEALYDTYGCDYDGGQDNWIVYNCKQNHAYFGGCVLEDSITGSCMEADAYESGSALNDDLGFCDFWNIFPDEGGHVIQLQGTNLCLQEYGANGFMGRVRLADCGVNYAGVPSEGWHWLGA